jgi:hypothetical protein
MLLIKSNSPEWHLKVLNVSQARSAIFLSRRKGMKRLLALTLSLASIGFVASSAEAKTDKSFAHTATANAVRQITIRIGSGSRRYNRRYNRGYSRTYNRGYYRNYNRGYYTRSYSRSYYPTYSRGYSRTYSRVYYPTYNTGYYRSYNRGYNSSVRRAYRRGFIRGYTRGTQRRYTQRRYVIY